MITYARLDKTMKKTLLTAIICAFTATSAVFGQHTQSITFSGPTVWTPGTTVSLNVFLTINYDAVGLAYWLEVPNALAPFIAITNVQYFTFPDPNQPPVYPILFDSTSGASSGYMVERPDLGATGNSSIFPPPPPSYHITTITFSLAAGAPNGSYTMLTTSHFPRTSEVADTDFNDNNIIPPGMFGINVGAVPEPSTLALLSFAAVGWGVLIYRRRNRSESSSID